MFAIHTLTHSIVSPDIVPLGRLGTDGTKAACTFPLTFLSTSCAPIYVCDSKVRES